MNSKEKKIDTSVWNTDNVTEFKDLAENGQSFTGDLSNWNLSALKPKIMKVTNQHEQVLWYLYNWDKFSLVDVIKDSMFFKFQTRLSDLEHRYGTLAKREKKTIKNRFGRECTFYIYSAQRKQYIKQIYKAISK